MESVGQQLKTAREKKQMSISDVVSSTKINSQIIEAIERDNFNSIAVPVYARGFIKLYAQCVEIDPAPLLKAYNIYHVHGSLNPRTAKDLGQMEAIDKSRKGKKIHDFILEELTSVRSQKPDKSLAKSSRGKVRINRQKIRAMLAAKIKLLQCKLTEVRQKIFSRTFSFRMPELKIHKINLMSFSRAAFDRLTKQSHLLSRVKLPVETCKTVILVAVCILLAAGVIGLIQYSARTDEPSCQIRWVQEPPAPYIEHAIK